MKRLLFSSVALVCCLLCLSCTDDIKNDSGRPGRDPSAGITLTTFTPKQGRILEQVLLRGDNFGSDPKIIKVYFNRKPAKVIGAVGDELFVVTPRTPGDTCAISVVIGKDSATYPDRFLYSKSSNVTTILGNDDTKYSFSSNLSKLTLNPTSVHYDEVRKDLIIAVQIGTEGDDGTSHILRFNEEQNVAEELVMNRSYFAHSQSAWVDDKIYFIDGRWKNNMFSLDPNEAYRKREFTVPHKLGPTGVEQEAWGEYTNMQWRGSLAYSKRDNCFYHIAEKLLVKTPYKSNLNESAQEIIEVLPHFRASVKIALHPVHQNLLFIFAPKDVIPNDKYPGEPNGVNYSNSISVIDLDRPESSLRKLNINSPGEGHRDGFLQDAQFTFPGMITIDHEGDIYLADHASNRIRKITLDIDSLEMSAVETLAGGGSGTNVDGDVTEAQFAGPSGICVSPEGIIYVACRGRLRRIALE